MKHLIIILFMLPIFITGCTSNRVITATHLAKPGGIKAPLPMTETEIQANKYFARGHQQRANDQLTLSAESFKLAYNTLSETDPVYAKGSLANEYGLALIKIYKYNEAIPIITDALKFNTQSNDKVGMAVSNLNLGDAYNRSSAIMLAKPYWEQANIIAKEINHRNLIIATSQRLE